MKVQNAEDLLVEKSYLVSPIYTTHKRFSLLLSFLGFPVLFLCFYVTIRPGSGDNQHPDWLCLLLPNPSLAQPFIDIRR